MSTAKWLHEFPVELGSATALRSMLGLHSHMPAQPVHMNCIGAFDFGRMASAHFAKMLQCLAERSDSAMIYVAAVELSSDGAYRDQFGLVPAFGLSREDLADKYLEHLNWGPERGGADSLANHADLLVATCPSLSWAVVGERDFELARLFLHKSLKKDFGQCVPAGWRYRAEDVEERLVDGGINRGSARLHAAIFGTD